MTWKAFEARRRDRRLAWSGTAALVVVFLAVLSIGLIADRGADVRAASQGDTSPEYVSSAVCAVCHAEAFSNWKTSHHSWALREATPENVLGDFDDTIFEHGEARTRFLRRGDSYVVETEAPDGEPTEFPVRYTVGVSPLQQYLIETDNGRLQALDIAWDTESNRWFHLYPEQKVSFGDGLHWSGPYKNWQARCAECHQTNFTKGYSPKSRSYRSGWSELTIGCEACHGPGSAHVAWAREPQSFAARRPGDVDAKGLSVRFRDGGQTAEVELCGACHSRRSPLGADSPPPGGRYGDHYRLALLRDGLYHADGQIDDEVYVFGSFLQSKMHARGVRCSDCHDPHGGDLKASGNDVCTQCHNPAGNEAFPTLRRALYDAASHHRHDPGKAGSRCVDCHMPAKTYMQVDPRRDHSFRVPRPDLSEKLGTPNACNGCHEDKASSWAASRVREWFSDGRSGTPHYGEVLYAGRTDRSAETEAQLLALAHDGDEPAIVRATALETFGRVRSPEHLQGMGELLADPSDLVRAAALRTFVGAPIRDRLRAAVPMLDDPRKAVRVEAARLLIGLPLASLNAVEKRMAREAISEYQASLFARADYPETQMQIAGLAMALRHVDAAESAFREAIAMDPQLPDAWLALARVQAATNDRAKAIKTLEDASEVLPDNGYVFRELGFLYASRRDNRQSNAALERSLKLLGPTPEVIELLVLNHLALNDIAMARSYAERLRQRFPDYDASPAVRAVR